MTSVLLNIFLVTLFIIASSVPSLCFAGKFVYHFGVISLSLGSNNFSVDNLSTSSSLPLRLNCSYYMGFENILLSLPHVDRIHQQRGFDAKFIKCSDFLHRPLVYFTTVHMVLMVLPGTMLVPDYFGKHSHSKYYFNEKINYVINGDELYIMNLKYLNIGLGDFVPIGFFIK